MGTGIACDKLVQVGKKQTVFLFTGFNIKHAPMRMAACSTRIMQQFHSAAGNQAMQRRVGMTVDRMHEEVAETHESPHPVPLFFEAACASMKGQGSAGRRSDNSSRSRGTLTSGNVLL